MTTPISDQLITRAKLAADYRISRAYGGPLAGAYAHARFAIAQGTLLDKGDDVQTEADRLGDYFGRPRYFAQVQVPWGTYRKGQCATFTWPRYGFGAGKKMMIIDVGKDSTRRTMTLTLRG
jgi:hypothetical protein